MTRGRLWADEDASVARESTYVFPFLGMWCRLNDSNFDCRNLTWFKYPYILSSLASNSPPTWLTTSLESENTFMAYSPILWTMDTPSNKASYSTSLFVAENPGFSNFSIVSFPGEIKTSPTPEPLWFDAPLTYTFQKGGSCKEIVPTDFPSMFCVVDISFNVGSANSTTRSANIWPLTEVRGMYLMSKAPRMVPHFAILPV